MFIPDLPCLNIINGQLPINLQEQCNYNFVYLSYHAALSNFTILATSDIVGDEIKRTPHQFNSL